MDVQKKRIVQHARLCIRKGDERLKERLRKRRREQEFPKRLEL